MLSKNPVTPTTAFSCSKVHRDGRIVEVDRPALQSRRRAPSGSRVGIDLQADGQRRAWRQARANSTKASTFDGVVQTQSVPPERFVAKRIESKNLAAVRNHPLRMSIDRIVRAWSVITLSIARSEPSLRSRRGRRGIAGPHGHANATAEHNKSEPSHRSSLRDSPLPAPGASHLTQSVASRKR